MRVVRPLLACAVVAATFAAPAAEAACVGYKSFGSACVVVDPNSAEPVKVSCGGYNWTCA